MIVTGAIVNVILYVSGLVILVNAAIPFFPAFRMLTKLRGVATALLTICGGAVAKMLDARWSISSYIFDSIPLKYSFVRFAVAVCVNVAMILLPMFILLLPKILRSGKQSVRPIFKPNDEGQYMLGFCITLIVMLTVNMAVFELH